MRECWQVPAPPRSQHAPRQCVRRAAGSTQGSPGAVGWARGSLTPAASATFGLRAPAGAPRPRAAPARPRARGSPLAYRAHHEVAREGVCSLAAASLRGHPAPRVRGPL